MKAQKRPRRALLLLGLGLPEVALRRGAMCWGWGVSCLPVSGGPWNTMTHESLSNGIRCQAQVDRGRVHAVGAPAQGSERRRLPTKVRTIPGPVPAVSPHNLDGELGGDTFV